MPIVEISPEETQAELEQDKSAIYLDVRSIPEFEAEHPKNAINIPIMHRNEGTGSMEPNPDFLKVALVNLPKDKRLFVGCLRGGRSLKACQLLEQNGYEKLHNVEGGFGGAVDPSTGLVSQKGWKASGLPVSTESKENETYRALREKAFGD
ncbi:MAG: rhodanese-like domain-containing protein [Deltaproteobacteria bacterium]|nr:rhodanese-like domain-containing protein [Deltaproteobacteria bacterium]